MISARTSPTTTLQPRPSLPPHPGAGGPADFDALVVSGARWVLLGCAVWALLIVVAAGVELVSGGRTRALTWVAAPAWVRRLVLSLLGATLVGVPATAGLATAAVTTTTTTAAAAPAGSTTTGIVGTVVPGAPGPNGADEWGGGNGSDGSNGAAGPDGLPLPSRPAIEAAPLPVPTPSSSSTRPAAPSTTPGSPSSSPSPSPTRPASPTGPSSPTSAPSDGAARPVSPGEAGGGSAAGTAPTGGPTGPARAASSTEAATVTHVVVRPGDCLWDLAARRLPPGASRAEVAAAVRRLHALNHRLIGPDPDLLRPGQRLAVPRRL
ncbi:hypothetical protein GCM10027596_10780 [Nocardioides korecus]